MRIAKDLCNISVETLVTVRQINAKSGKVVSETKPQKNLVFDGGLNALARSTNSTYPAEFSTICRVGDGTTPDKVSSGAITFTQVGTTVTASAGFFTAGMVGYIFKYGSGTAGAEYYITAFTNTTTVTVDTSATVAVPTVATVWNVARSTLANLLFTSSSYESTAGSCQSTVTGNVVAHKRTYNFAQQVSSFNVNEVGYFRASAGSTIFGRVILGSTVVVAPTNFLQVVITVSFTYSPTAPAAVTNVGTNIDTSGTAALEQLLLATATGGNYSYVLSNGGNQLCNAGYALDGSGSIKVGGRIGATYTQANPVGTSPPSWATINTNWILFAQPSWTFATLRGKMTATTNTTISTAGQTMYGVGLISGAGTGPDPALPGFDIKLTTPFVLPSGSFLPQVVFSQTFNRILNN